MSGQAPVNGGQPFRRRPGPFGPAWALLPKGQRPLLIDDSTPIYDALDRMIDNNYSQLPVKNKDGKIVGVFTWKSFCKRVGDLRAIRGNLRPIDLPVKEAMEAAKFIHAEVYIDTETDWTDLDYVLVGSDSNLLGILSIADVLGRLNDFAEAFVLIYEIEHEVRDLIHDLCDETKFQELIIAMRLAPEARQPATLEEFTFIQYKSLICTKANWPMFEPVFDTLASSWTLTLPRSATFATRSCISAGRLRLEKRIASADFVTSCATTGSYMGCGNDSVRNGPFDHKCPAHRGLPACRFYPESRFRRPPPLIPSAQRADGRRSQSGGNSEPGSPSERAGHETGE